MRIADFALERYFARWEFAVEHLLCASDVQAYPMADLLALADDESRALWDGLTLGYTELTGHPLLRREIAALYAGLEADDVLVFAGAEEGIFCLVNVLLGPGDHAIVTWPGYQSLYEIARATGADVTLHELREAADWRLDLDLLRSQVTPATKLIVVNAPHNPTGMLPDRATFDGLVAIAEDAGAHLLMDEVYRFLEFDEADRLPAGAEVLDRGVSLGVMSKSFAMAGLRIGWLATRDRSLLGRCAAFKDYTTICASAPSEILALIGLRAREAVLDRSRGIVAANLDAPGRVLRGLARPVRLGAPAGRVGRRSRASPCRASASTIGRPAWWKRRVSCSCRARNSGSVATISGSDSGGPTCRRHWNDSRRTPPQRFADRREPPVAPPATDRTAPAPTTVGTFGWAAGRTCVRAPVRRGTVLPRPRLRGYFFLPS